MAVTGTGVEGGEGEGDNNSKLWQWVDRHFLESTGGSGQQMPQAGTVTVTLSGWWQNESGWERWNEER